MANAIKEGTEMGVKDKYERMDSLEEEEDEGLEVKWMQRRRGTKKYVYACALFASLNSILLGYGELIFIFKLFHERKVVKLALVLLCNVCKVFVEISSRKKHSHFSQIATT